jgi:hypothetical protein
VLVVRVGCCVSRVEFYVFSGLLFRHDVCDHVNDPHGKKNRKKVGERRRDLIYKLVRHRRQVFPFRFYSRTKKAVPFSYILPTLVSYWSSVFVCVSLRVCVCDTQKHQKKRRERTKFRGCAPSRRHAPIRHPKPPRPESRPLCHSTAARLFVYISRPATLFRVISSTLILLYIYILPPSGFN